MDARQAPAALAARRALITALGLGATVAAHVAATGARVGPGAVVLAGTLVIAAMLVGPRRAPFRPRRPGATLALLAGVQAGAHLAMWSAPWAAGLEPHHHAPLLAPAALAIHAAAALALAVLVRHVEGVLAAALAAARALRRWLAPPLAGPRPARVPAPASAAPGPPVALGSRAARAPPR